MSKLAYLECPTGIAGDMCLGALVSAGVPLEYLIEQLKKLGIEQEYQLNAQSVHRNGQLATKVHVDILTQPHHHDHHSHHHGRHLPEIEHLIAQAELPPRAEAWSLAVFRQLAVAEGAVHGISPEKVHFHEVGAVDAIVDIVGTCLGLDWLGIESNSAGLPLLYCSALPTGGGTVRAAHGQMAVPVPAVLKLWEMRGTPVYSNGIERELVTPTGAAIATTLAQDFGSPPAMTIERVGLGAGARDLPISNILRLWLGTTVETFHQTSLQTPTTSPKTIQISVSNSGVEIPASEIPRIFDKFYRIRAHDVWNQGGTGLGLALVQQLVTRLGGKIFVNSSKGQTCFTVELPLKN